MIRTIIFLLLFLVILIVAIPIGIITRLVEGKDKFAPLPRICNGIIRYIIYPMVCLAGAKHTIIGKENLPDGPALFVANHQGNFDAMFVLYAFDRIPVIIAKKETEKLPIVHMWMTIIHCIFMDRGNVRAGLQSIKDATEYLEHGFSVAIFPEGTRSQGPDMGEFKSGAFKAAVKAKVPVVPVAIDGSYKMMEEKKHLAKADIKISILKPIEIDGTEKTQELAEQAQALVQAELDRLRA
ncbi:MAG: 1-acyl-sn-glycerol-3-phosphate acyltransferase [Clostridia bacterium]|nr:1-acyl-sn-glycerol-3-phosphate acyltransferase [Clostridia bacterium]